MKMNWGYKIVLVYGIFVLGMMILVIKSSQQKYDFVQKDYYAEELKYQQVIDASKHSKDLGGEVKVFLENNHLVVELPVGFKKANVNGTAHLYYAADEKKDLIKAFSTSNGIVEMNLLTKAIGAYTLKLNVEMNGEKYYYEQKLFF